MKLALVFSFQDSDWESCKSITKNLHQSYSQLENVEIQNFNLNKSINKYSYLSLVEDIFSYSPDRVVFIDHMPVPALLISLLGNKLDKDVEYIAHLFGDLVLFINEWSRLEKKLEGLKIKFVAASEKQSKIVNKVFKNAGDLIYPFPVDENLFHFEKNIKKINLDVASISDEDFVFVYTGRFSRLKNISELISAFEKMLITTKEENTKLLLYGAYDNIGLSYVKGDLDGEYCADIYRQLNSLPLFIREKIIFQPFASNKMLKTIYNASDCFVSLSTYHDEDYGMSIIEALSCGLPLILSDWAGYSSFGSTVVDAIKYVRCELDLARPRVNVEQASQLMVNAIKDKDTLSRQKTSKYYSSRYSVKGLKPQLKNILEEKSEQFSGVTSLTNQLIQSLNDTGGMLGVRERYNDLYMRLYSDYC